MAATARAQETQQPVPGATQVLPAPSLPSGTPLADAPAVDFNPPASPWSTRGLLTGNHNFDNFIGFMSNPLQNIDPRAVTEFWPVFVSNWISPYGKILPSGNVQLYGAGVYLALSERLSVGLNQGGYAVADVRQVRQGWLNLGGFAQYTVIQNVPGQFLLTTGLRWVAPTGEAVVFQGHGPAQLAPYLTMGKGFGNVHLLATTGYQFPAASGATDTRLFYFNGHIDRQCFGWLYPLFEVNWIQHSTAVDLNRTFLNNFFDFGTFEQSGNVVSMAAGFNAVLVRNRLELGAVYERPLFTQTNFTFNGLLVKLVMRY
jgi:hypothetical protein